MAFIVFLAITVLAPGNSIHSSIPVNPNFGPIIDTPHTRLLYLRYVKAIPNTDHNILTMYLWWTRSALPRGPAYRCLNFNVSILFIIDDFLGMSSIILFDFQTLPTMVILHHDGQLHGLEVLSRIRHSPTVAARQPDKPRLRHTNVIAI